MPFNMIQSLDKRDEMASFISAFFIAARLEILNLTRAYMTS